MSNKYSIFVKSLWPSIPPARAVIFKDHLHAVSGICGESGEVADLVKKSFIYNIPLDCGKLVEELGDLLHYIQMELNVIDVSMEDCIEANMAKVRIRYPDGYCDVKAEVRNKKAEQGVFDKFRR